MKNLSRFDLGMIIAFVVVALVGGGAWYYLSGQLETAKQAASSASSDFDKYSTKQVYLPTPANEKTLQANIDLLKSLIDPLVQSKLQSSDNKVLSVTKQDTVAWKHDLDERVRGLNNAAKLKGITVPANFYYGFSRYLGPAPGEEKTVILTKQLLGIEQIANILINAPVKSIQTVRRTYDEDESTAGSGSSGAKADKDYLGGRAINAEGGMYIDYPFEIEFEVGADSLRKVINDLTKSPYVFVLRTITLQNSKLTSPQLSDLAKLAPRDESISVTDSSPGAVAANARSTKGPQFLFGGEYLRIKMRVDMVEWKGMAEGK